MSLEVVLECEEGLNPALKEAEILSIVEAVLEYQKVERDCSLSVSFVSDAEIARLNAEWRGVDAPTDVLSLECERPDDPDLPEGVPAELGDIVIAPDFVATQAASFATTPADETRLMLVHATLHLLGYDHIEPADAAVMQPIEDAILECIPTDGTLSQVVLTSHREDVLV